MTSLCCSVAACDSGRWGPDCSYACNCSAGHGGCDAVSGLCVCEAGYVGPRCEERESRPGPHTHVHMHARAHTHAGSRAHIHTHTYKCQGDPALLPVPGQAGVSSSKPTPNLPHLAPLPPATLLPAWAQEKAHVEQRQREMGSMAPQGAPATCERGGKCLLRTKGPALQCRPPPWLGRWVWVSWGLGS